jgi:hypothetical protein
MRNGAEFPGLYEELPFIAIYLLVSLKRDKALFTEFSTIYDDDYIADMEAQNDTVKNLISPLKLTGEMKVITKLVADDYTKIRGVVNRAESYLKKAKTGLTMAADDFGVSQVRDELEAKNDEGIVKNLRMLFNNLEDNKAVLVPKGYTPAVSTKFAALIESLGTDSVAQNLKKDSRITLTRENIETMNVLWRKMDEVMEDGKKIAKEKKNDAMLLDYSFKYIQKKVRLDRKKKEEEEGGNGGAKTL